MELMKPIRARLGGKSIDRRNTCSIYYIAREYMQWRIQMENVYEVCPTFKSQFITLRQTIFEDAEELLKCYSDVNAVPFFNSDNCNGDTFFYTTVERLKKTMELWDYSYKHKHFVRWTVIVNKTNEIIGTIEMFHRRADDEFDHYGILRIDLQSKFENREVINSILEITNQQFYKLFDVRSILTKAIPTAKERILSLKENRFSPLNKKFMIYDDYFIGSQEVM